MKKNKNLFSLLFALVFIQALHAQLNGFHEVTVTFDVQPFLQLKMDGPDQIDFTFDDINKYYAGIVKYGATVLRVSATVNWDLWAVGLSQGNQAANEWDQQVPYQAVPLGGVSTIPLSALEIHQTPANPATALGCNQVSGAESDYSSAFTPRDPLGNTIASNNLIYNQSPANAYTAPLSDGTASGLSEKYIAGGSTDDATNAGCGIPAGSYLMQGALTSDYYYVIDYRIVPGLPVIFPASNNTAPSPVNFSAQSVIDAYTNSGTLYTTGYASPGVYTMYVKYILIQDQ